MEYRFSYLRTLKFRLQLTYFSGPLLEVVVRVSCS